MKRKTRGTTMPGHVRVTRIIRNTDMRQTRALAERALNSTLSQGCAWLHLNRRYTMARLVDCVGGVHTYYAPKGTLFDAWLLQEQANALNLTVHVPNLGKREAA